MCVYDLFCVCFCTYECSDGGVCVGGVCWKVERHVLTAPRASLIIKAFFFFCIFNLDAHQPKPKVFCYSLILEKGSLRCLCTSLFCWSELFHYSQTSVVPSELRGFIFGTQNPLEQPGTDGLR